MRRTEIDGERVVEMYLSGVSVIGIARELGCSDGPIYRELIDAGVRVSRQADINPARLRQMYVDEQLSFNEIGRRFGVVRATIRNHLLRAGVPLRTHVESLQPM